MNIKEQIEYMESIEDFIQHNINNKYIKPETTVEELLQFIKNIKEHYLLILQKNEDNFNLNKIRIGQVWISNKVVAQIKILEEDKYGYECISLTNGKKEIFTKDELLRGFTLVE